MTIEQVEASGVPVFLADLAADLLAGTYRPAAVRRVAIPKPGQPGKTRPLSIPTVRDRVVMTAAKLILEPVFEADFLPSGYGFPPVLSAAGCSRRQARRRPPRCLGRSPGLVQASSRWARMHGG